MSGFGDSRSKVWVVRFTVKGQRIRISGTPRVSVLECIGAITFAILRGHCFGVLAVLACKGLGFQVLRCIVP